MGWNTGYEIYEQTVIAVYDSGGLTAQVLQQLIKPYENTDIDHGGKNNLVSTDGLSADEIVIKLLAPDFWQVYEARGRTYDTDFSDVWTDVMKCW